MDLFLIVLPVLWIVLFGILDAAQTARKDYANMSIFWRHPKDYWDEFVFKAQGINWRTSVLKGNTIYTKFDLWYLGGNNWYPDPGLPWNCDFWHFCKNCWTYCIGLCAMSIVVVAIQVPSYWLLLYGLLYGVEGLTFMFFYHYIFRKDRNINEFINRLIFKA